MSQLIVTAVTLQDNPGNTVLVEAKAAIRLGWNGPQSVEYLCHANDAPQVGSLVEVTVVA